MLCSLKTFHGTRHAGLKDSRACAVAGLHDDTGVHVVADSEQQDVTARIEQAYAKVWYRRNVSTISSTSDRCLLATAAKPRAPFMPVLYGDGPKRNPAELFQALVKHISSVPSNAVLKNCTHAPSPHARSPTSISRHARLHPARYRSCLRRYSHRKVHMRAEPRRRSDPVVLHQHARQDTSR